MQKQSLRPDPPLRHEKPLRLRRGGFRAQTKPANSPDRQERFCLPRLNRACGLRSGKIPCPAVFFTTLAICCVWQYPKEVSLAYALHASGFMTGAPFPASPYGRRAYGCHKNAALKPLFGAVQGRAEAPLLLRAANRSAFSILSALSMRSIACFSCPQAAGFLSANGTGLSPGRHTAIAGPSKPAFAGNMRRITVSWAYV